MENNQNEKIWYAPVWKATLNGLLVIFLGLILFSLAFLEKLEWSEFERVFIRPFYSPLEFKWLFSLIPVTLIALGICVLKKRKKAFRFAVNDQYLFYAQTGIFRGFGHFISFDEVLFPRKKQILLKEIDEIRVFNHQDLSSITIFLKDNHYCTITSITILSKPERDNIIAILKENGNLIGL